MYNHKKPPRQKSKTQVAAVVPTSASADATEGANEGEIFGTYFLLWSK